jgi:hypothetical protein
METLQETEKQQLAEVIEADTQAVTNVVHDMKIQCTEMTIEIEISKLNRPSYHSRAMIKEKYLSIQKSLQQHGFLGGIFVCEDNLNVIDGWHRLLIWDSLENEKIPCYLVTCSEHQERELHIRLNTQAAAFDLTQFGLTMPEIDLVKDFGFSEADLKAANAPLIKDEKPRQAKASTDLKKITAQLKTSIYDRLNRIKEELKYENWPDVLEVLIQVYEGRDNGDR